MIDNTVPTADRQTPPPAPLTKYRAEIFGRHVNGKLDVSSPVSTENVYLAADVEAQVTALIARLTASWRCFHCDEVFTDKADAFDHFGTDIDRVPACRLSTADVKQLRALEALNDRLSRELVLLENDARLWHEAEADRVRRIGNRQWWQELDSREGETLVLQERVAALTAERDIAEAKCTESERLRQAAIRRLELHHEDLRRRQRFLDDGANVAEEATSAPLKKGERVIEDAAAERPLWWAALATKLKEECESQHARAERAETELAAVVAQRDALQRDVEYHSECRPNRRQAEAAMADAKALADWRADVTVALGREGGAHYVDVPQHIRDVRKRADLAEAQLASLGAAIRGLHAKWRHEAKNDLDWGFAEGGVEYNYNAAKITGPIKLACADALAPLLDPKE